MTVKTLELTNGWTKILFADELTQAQRIEHADADGDVSQMFIPAGEELYPTSEFIQYNQKIGDIECTGSMGETNNSMLVFESKTDGMDIVARLYRVW